MLNDQHSVAGTWRALSGGGTGPEFTFDLDRGPLFVASIVTGLGGAGGVTVYLDARAVAGEWVQVAQLPRQSAPGAEYAAVSPRSASPTVEVTGVGRLRWEVHHQTGTVNAALSVLQA